MPENEEEPKIHIVSETERLGGNLAKNPIGAEKSPLGIKDSRTKVGPGSYRVTRRIPNESRGKDATGDHQADED
jgi:hypothetical protein